MHQKITFQLEALQQMFTVFITNNYFYEQRHENIGLWMEVIFPYKKL
jgi:hypothetical protein